MNIFFIGMGNMGQQRLHAVSQLKKKYDLNVVGFYDPFVEFITFNDKKIIQSFLSKNAKVFKKII